MCVGRQLIVYAWSHSHVLAWIEALAAAITYYSGRADVRTIVCPVSNQHCTSYPYPAWTSGRLYGMAGSTSILRRWLVVGILFHSLFPCMLHF